MTCKVCNKRSKFWLNTTLRLTSSHRGPRAERWNNQTRLRICTKKWMSCGKGKTWTNQTRSTTSSSMTTSTRTRTMRGRSQKFHLLMVMEWLIQLTSLWTKDPVVNKSWWTVRLSQSGELSWPRTLYAKVVSRIHRPRLSASNPSRKSKRWSVLPS